MAAVDTVDTVDIAVWLTSPDVACWSFAERHARRLEAALAGVRVTTACDEEAFRRALPSARIALVWTFDPRWLAEAPRLEWVVTPAAGRDLIGLRPGPGVDVDHGSFHGEIMAETVLGCLLAHCRGIVRAARLQEEDPWPRAALAPSLSTLRGSRVTILGFGSIGRWIGRLAKPFGVRLTGVERTPDSAPDYLGPDDRLIPARDLDGVLPETDFLVLALPGDRTTERIIDARRLDLLPSSAVLVNVGRGNALDEEHLARKLRERTLAAAYLDVYQEEPLPSDSPLREAPDAYLLPHAAAIAPRYLDLFVEEFIDRYRRRFGGR